MNKSKIEENIRMKESSHNVFSKLPYQVKRRSFLPVSSSKNCITMMGCASKNIAKILSYIDNCGHMAEYVNKNIARIFDKQWKIFQSSAKKMQWYFKSIERILQKYCITLTTAVIWRSRRAKILQEYLKNISIFIALHWQQWSPGGVCELRKEWRQWGCSVSSIRPHTISFSSLVFVFSFVLVFVRIISCMRRLMKSKLDVFCRFYRGMFFTAGNVLMEGSNFKCLNYLILKTIYPSGLHFWASCPQNQMAR